MLLAESAGKHGSSGEGGKAWNWSRESAGKYSDWFHLIGSNNSMLHKFYEPTAKIRNVKKKANWFGHLLFSSPYRLIMY